MHDMEANMPTPTQLREESIRFRKVADTETTLALKDRLFSHALALDYLAERIEREAALEAELVA
jgi:hypothetical protein